MSDWVYIAGEDDFNQDFEVVNRKQNAGFDGSLVTSADLTIKDSDLTDTSPVIQNNNLSIVTLDPLVLRYSINIGDSNSEMPQTPAVYLVFVRVMDSLGRTLKTFEADLRVLFGG